MRRALLGLAAAACAPLLAACAFVGGGSDDGPFPTMSPHPGMKGVSWRNFAFGAPSAWQTDAGGGAPDGTAAETTWQDASGDIQMTGSSTNITTCPKPGRSGSLPEPGHRATDTGQLVTGVRHFHVPGAAGALRYTLTGGRGGDEVELQVWPHGCDTQLILDIYATDAADQIADTIIAQPDD